MKHKKYEKQQKIKKNKEKEIERKKKNIERLANMYLNIPNEKKIFKEKNSEEKITPTLYLINSLEETKKEINESYEALKNNIETKTNKESILYGVKFKKEIIAARIEIDESEIGINIYPIIDGEHEYDCGFGNDEYIATLENYNKYNKPSFTLLKDVILNLMEPVLDKVSEIDWSELENFCGNAQGQLDIERDEPEEIELPELLKEKPDMDIIKKQFSEVIINQIKYHIKNKIPGNIIIQGLQEKIIPIINSKIFKEIVESEEFKALEIQQNTNIIFKIYQDEMQQL